MKSYNKVLMFTAAIAAMSLVSCQKQEFKPEKGGMTITLNANVEEFGNVSKSHIEESDGIYKVIWDAGETMRTWVYNETAASSSLTTGFTTDENGNGLFTVKIPTPSEGTDWTSIAGVYPSSATESGTNAELVRVNLPNIQSPSNNSYAPDAYILLARPAALTVEDGGQLDASFYRATALNKFTVTNLEHGGNIVSAKITFPEEKQAAGYKRFNLKTTTPVDYTSTQNNIELRYASPLAAGTNGEYVLWFTTWEVNITPEETVTVEITTEDYKYTKNFTGNTASFKESFLNFLSIDMTGATAEELAPAEDYSGEYLIITKYNDEGWYYMTNQNTDNKDFEQGTTTISSSRDFNTLSKEDFSSIENIENNLWKISKFNDGYSVYNAASQQYITLGGSNRTAGVSAEETTLYITKQEDSTFQISNMEGGQWYLQYNFNGDYFANYKGTQQDIYLLPWVESTEPMLIVSQPEQTVAADAESVSFTYVARNITGTITAVEGTDTDNIISAVTVDKASSTVNVTLNPNTEEVEKTATITLSADGANAVTLTVKQEAAIAEVTPVKATIAEFIAAEVNTTDWYELTGTIVSISNTQFGNLTIQDETGSIYIYGLTSTKQNSNDNSFSSIGLKVGDVLTLATLRGEYKGEAQGGGDIPAYYISHEQAPVQEGTEIINMSDFFSGKENLENGKTYIWGGLSVTFEKHNSSTSNYDGAVMRLYANDKLTFNAGDKTIVKMEFEATQGTWSADTGTISGYNWEGESSIVTLTATKQVRFSKITVTYKQ